MLIYEIVKPGEKIISENLVWCRNMERQIRDLIDLYFEANFSLIQFLDATEELFSLEVKLLWENARKDSFEKIGIRYPAQHFLNFNTPEVQTQIDSKRNLWKNGIQPNEFRQIRVNVNAKNFIAALDSFEKHLNILKTDAPKELENIHSEFLNQFPDLRGVRNTNQHMEDRRRGLGAGRIPKPIELKPTNLPNFQSDGLLAFDITINNTYNTIMSNGSIGQVDVSPKSMEFLQVTMNKIFNLFIWDGKCDHLPSGDSSRYWKQELSTQNTNER